MEVPRLPSMVSPSLVVQTMQTMQKTNQTNLYQTKPNLAHPQRYILSDSIFLAISLSHRSPFASSFSLL